MDEPVDIFKLLENVVFLKKYTFFSGLHAEDLKTLAFIILEKRYQDNEVVVREEEPGDSFFLVKQGSLRIEKGGQELARIAENGCFGEMALFEEGALRSATVVAEGECSLLVIQKEAFFNVLNRAPAISIEMLKLFAERLRDANRKLSERTLS